MKLKQRVKTLEAETVGLSSQLSQAGKCSETSGQILRELEASNAKLKLKNDRLEHEKKELQKAMEN